MKILIIPDVHGRDFWVEPCKHVDNFDKIIFLGDYHDPYSFQVSSDTSRHRLRDELVPFVEANRDKVVCLFGNHDGNYLVDKSFADRYDYFHAAEIKELISKLNVKLIHKEGEYLFTHSGVLPEWLDINGLTLESLETLPLTHPALEQVSPYRGGWNRCGSCVWGDSDEYRESEHIPGFYQIFGHSQQSKDPIITTDYACLDCRKAFILDTETKELKEWEEEN